MTSARGREGGHAADAKRTTAPLADELPQLLSERGMTLRALARAAGVDHAHLSRVVNQRQGKRPTAELAARLAIALELPKNFFVEYREAVVLDAVRVDGRLRDQLYDQLADP